MTTIQSTLQLYDNFSNRLSAINSAVQATTRHMERLRTATNAHMRFDIQVANEAILMNQVHMIRQRIQSQLRVIHARIQIQLPASLEAMFGNLQMLVLRLIRVVRQLRTTSGANAAELQNALQRIERLEQKINQLQDQLNRRLREGGRNSEGMLSNLRNIAAAYVSIAAAKGLFETVMGGAMEQQQMISTFVARSGSEALGNAIYDAITKQALAAGQDVQQALSGTMSFMSSTLDPKQLAQLNKLSMRLAKLNPMEGLEGAAFSMKELLSGDYTSIVERFNIGRGMIKNSDALKAGKAGDIEGFIKGMDKLLIQQNLSEKAFEKMLDSPAAKWQKLVNTFKFNLAQAGNAAVNAFAPLFDVINKAFASGKFDQFFGSIQAGMAMIAQVTSSVVQFLINNWDLVKNTLLVLGVVAAAVAIGFAVDWIIAVWPLALIVTGIIGVITILNKFGVSTSEVIGFVTGVFYGLFAFINNQVALVWNVILSFAEFLVNIFIDPVYAIKKLFYDLFQTVTAFFNQLINNIIDGINWLIQKINSVTDTGIQAVAHITTDGVGPAKPTTDKNVVNLDKYKMSMMSIGGNFNKGYKAATDFTKSVGKLTNNLGGGAYKVPKMPKQNGAGDIGKVGKVGKVGKIEDKVDISSEDLKVMRDLAEMKSIQNFNYLTPTIQVRTGDINSGADLDTIIKKIGDHLEEQFVSTAQGVYT